MSQPKPALHKLKEKIWVKMRTAHPLRIPFVIMAFYMISRFFVYRYFPEDGFEQWVSRDTIMNIPRVVGLIAGLVYGIDVYGVKPLIALSKVALAVVLGVTVVEVYIEFLYRNSTYAGLTMPGNTFVVLCASSLAVGFFEEVLFRWILLSDYLKKYSLYKSIFYSSFWFMMFHIQAQPLEAFPFLFIAGAIYAVMRFIGVSIIALALAHAFFDSVVFLLGKKADFPELGYWLNIVFLLCLLNILILTKRKLYHRSLVAGQR